MRRRQQELGTPPIFKGPDVDEGKFVDVIDGWRKSSEKIRANPSWHSHDERLSRCDPNANVL